MMSKSVDFDEQMIVKTSFQKKKKEKKLRKGNDALFLRL